MVDEANALGEAFGYKAIPNGIFLDKRGVVRHSKFGGFSVANSGDVAAVERLLAAGGRRGAGPGGACDGSAPGRRPARGLDLLQQGDRPGAVAAWQEALREDPTTT